MSQLITDFTVFSLFCDERLAVMAMLLSCIDEDKLPDPEKCKETHEIISSIRAHLLKEMLVRKVL